jgi:hypothetical protein
MARILEYKVRWIWICPIPWICTGYGYTIQHHIWTIAWVNGCYSLCVGVCTPGCVWSYVPWAWAGVQGRYIRGYVRCIYGWRWYEKDLCVVSSWLFSILSTFGLYLTRCTYLGIIHIWAGIVVVFSWDGLILPFELIFFSACYLCWIHLMCVVCAYMCMRTSFFFL